MNKRLQVTKKSLIALYILFAILGAALALSTYFRFAYLARGIVGIAAIYLYVNQGRSNKQGEPIAELLRHPNKTKDFINIFLATLIITWSGLQILQVYIFYVLKK